MPQPPWKWQWTVTECSEILKDGEYGMGSRKYTPSNRWKRARKGLLHKERWDNVQGILN